jgi:hypothetical protein
MTSAAPICANFPTMRLDGHSLTIISVSRIQQHLANRRF